jgi:ligand-binding SRPBCC domain-containing protein
MMRYIRFDHATEFPFAVERLRELHRRPDALALLTPPALHLDVVNGDRVAAEGSVVEFRVGPPFLRCRWAALETGLERDCGFVDVAVAGPFPFWEHVHEFESLGRGRSRLRDVIWYTLPRPLPRWFGALVVNRVLRQLFAWRHARTFALLSRPSRPHRAVPADRGAVRPWPV